MTKMLNATAYVTLEPSFNRSTGEPTGFRLGKITVKPPQGRVPHIRLNVSIPAQVFRPLAPEVTIEVPEDALVWPEPEVTVDPEGADHG